MKAHDRRQATKRLAAALAAGLVASPALAAPVPPAARFAPIPAAQQRDYRLDFKRYFFADDAALDDAFAAARATTHGISALRGHLGGSADDLLAAMKLQEQLDPQLGRLWTYYGLRYAVDTRRVDEFARMEKLQAQIDAELAFFNPEVQAIPQPTWQRFLHDRPELERFRYPVEQIRRTAPHTLTPPEEALLGRLAPDLSGWPAKVYHRVLEQAPFGTLAADGHRYSVYRDLSDLLALPDRGVRKSAYTRYAHAFAKVDDVDAIAFVAGARAANDVAQVRRFADATDQTFFGIHLTPHQVDNAIAQVEAKAATYRRYQAIKRRYIAGYSHLDPVEVWDLDLVPPHFQRPRFTIAQATKVIESAIAPYDPAYRAEMANLLDPATHRLDVVKGPDRTPGAAAYFYHGGTGAFFSEGYAGYLDDVLTLGHEGGHVVAGALQQRAGFPPLDDDRPPYFTESFAIFNEFLIADHLYQQAKTHDEKVYYLQQELAPIMRLFDITMRSHFEIAAYRGVASGQIANARGLRSLWRGIYPKYRLAADRIPDADTNWAELHHYFDAPLYYQNYLFASLLALTYLDQSRHDPGFWTRYQQLLAGGKPEEPAALLADYLHVDLDDPRLLDRTFKDLDARLDAYERLTTGGRQARRVVLAAVAASASAEPTIDELRAMPMGCPLCAMDAATPSTLASPSLK